MDNENGKRGTVLVSACLVGEKCRYDGTAGRLTRECGEVLDSCWDVVPYCPECEGGLPVPRPPAEISGGVGEDVLEGKAKVMTAAGSDLTSPFLQGAARALAICRKYDIRVAILKERSPSCGGSAIYDGTFRGRVIDGAGVTTALLRRHGVAVFSEESVDEFRRYQDK